MVASVSTSDGSVITEPPEPAVTVIAVVPLLPSLVAVIVADPAATPVTSPLPLTLATAALLVAHVTTRPDRTLPLASFGTAKSCSVPPTDMDADAGVTVTEATGTLVTVTAAVPLFPSLVAVIVAEPAATPVTNPLPVTVAAAGLLDAQVTTRPVSAAPLASFGVAVSCTVCPLCRFAVAGLTVTDATGPLVTVTAAVPLLPSLVAVMVAEPAPAPVTNPLPLTVAAAGLLDAHVTTRPVSAAPLASCGVAVSCTVWPTCRLAVAGLTVTDATGTLDTVTAAVPPFPSRGAVAVASPPATPATTPLSVTVAAARLLDAHVTTRPDSGVPLASCGVAVSCTVCPTCRVAVAGLTVTDATDTLDTVTTAVSAFPPGCAAAITL